VGDEVSKKMVLLIIIFIVLLLVVIYTFMLISTNQIVRDVENVMRSNVAMELTEGLPIHMYNRQNEHGIRTFSYYVKINRIFVLHNFNEGYMWIRYWRKGYDSEGNVMFGSSDIPARWRIQKTNGNWEIIEIIEKP
jgi:hypothetical protein